MGFPWKDYRHHDKRKVMSLTADAFIRRFPLHVLPDGFARIRHYGLLGNRGQARRVPPPAEGAAAGAGRAGGGLPGAVRTLDRALAPPADRHVMSRRRVLVLPDTRVGAAGSGSDRDGRAP
jgi:hypothetical protein